jgi:hypothetical protein
MSVTELYNDNPTAETYSLSKHLAHNFYMLKIRLFVFWMNDRGVIIEDADFRHVSLTFTSHICKTLSCTDAEG